MKAFHFLLSIVFVVLVFNGKAQNSQNFKLPPGVAEGDYLQGHVILKFIPENVDSEKFNSFLNRIDADTIYKKFPFSPIPKEKTNKYGQPLTDLSLIYEVEFNPIFPIEDAINVLLSSGMLEYAVPNYLPHIMYTPNDPNIASQYHLTNIRAYQAWDICKGDSNTVVGITDTGIDFAHPDLVNAVKYNYNDPIDGLDNDNDGYVDNYRGWDMGSWDNNPQFGARAHGIHVCGISGASANNTYGIAGTGFNCKILPVKVDNQNGNLVATYQSVVYAADHGCKVINCSWGSSFSPGQYGQDIVNYVTFNRGALVVASAGNSNSLNPIYPASYNYVLSVAATDVNDVKWINSSFGYYIDISAPGKDVYSTWGGGGFITSSGTSMSGPCVAGAAALVSDYYPQLNMLQIAERLRTTADIIDTIAANTPYANWLGTGRLNMYRALTDPFSPSIRLDSYSFSDSADLTFFPGDTLYVNVSVLNYLDTSSANLYAQLECLSPYVALIDSIWTIGELPTMNYANNYSASFRLKLLNVPPSTKLDFLIHFHDNSYSSTDFFSTNVNKDYKLLDTNQIAVTVTSNGNLGYNDLINLFQGDGLRFEDYSSMVSGIGMMCGTSLLKVSDNLYSIIEPVDTDWVATMFVQNVVPAPLGDKCFSSAYNDNGVDSVFRIHVSVKQLTYAWNTPEDENFVMVRYTFFNNDTVNLSNFYAGLFADWDIITSNENRCWYDASLKTIIASNLDSSLFAAIHLLGQAPSFYYALDLDGFNSSITITDGFSESEKYSMLKANRTSAGTDFQGNDIAAMSSSGPYTIAPADSLQLTFAIIAGHNYHEIEEAVNRADVRFVDPMLSIQDNTVSNNLLLYPNPAADILYFVVPSVLNTSTVRILDISGRVCLSSTINSNSNSCSVNISSLQQGLYLVEISGANGQFSSLFSIAR